MAEGAGLEAAGAVEEGVAVLAVGTADLPLRAAEAEVAAAAEAGVVAAAEAEPEAEADGAAAVEARGDTALVGAVAPARVGSAPAGGSTRSDIVDDELPDVAGADPRVSANATPPPSATTAAAHT